MKAIFKKADHIIELIQDHIVLITGTSITLMILASALFRMIAYDWYGSEEIILFVATWLYFTGSISACRRKSHVSGDMLNMFITNKKITFICNVIKSILSLGMSVMFCIWACQFVYWQYDLSSRTSVYKLPMYLTQLPLAIMFVFWSIYLLRDLIALIKTGNQVKSEGEEQV